MELRKLVTIIAESSVERTLMRDLDELGISGYTISDARGGGSRGQRDGSWDEAMNTRIELVVDTAKSEEIIDHLVARYFEHFAMIAFTTDIAVYRSEKFTTGGTGSNVE